MGKPYTQISEKTAQRISKVIEATERAPHRILPPEQQVPRRGFWAKLTSTDGSGRYGWQAVRLNQSFDFTAEEFSADATGDDSFAVEVNGSKIMALDQIVFLEHSGSQPCWQFTMTPNLVYATLQSQLNPGSFSTAAYYIETPTGLIQGGDTIQVWAPPVWTGGNIAAGTTIECTFSPAYGRWYCTSNSCTTSYT